MGDKIRIRVKKPWIGYCGSTIQQNYGESLNHGYLLWDINHKDDFDVNFCELPNLKPYITVDWAGTVDATVALLKNYPQGSRCRIRSHDTLPQKEVALLVQRLQQELKATEVTFKNDNQVNRDLVQAGVTTLVRTDLRNPEVLLKLVKDYHANTTITDDEWDAVAVEINKYIRSVSMGDDDVVRNTKWSLKYLKFDHCFAYGAGNIINFDQLKGIVGIFGANRAGKSSIVGTILYSLFNTTDRGNIKNQYVVNVRHPYCYTKAIIDVNGVTYVVERQTAKHENKWGQVHAPTALNLFKIADNGDAIDLGGEERKDTDKVLRKLIGTGDDCLLTSIAAQDEVKLFINQGSTKRRQVLSRFLDLDIFDRMYVLAREDVKVGKSVLRSLPDCDWDEQHDNYALKLDSCNEQLAALEAQLHTKKIELDDLRRQLSTFSGYVPVTLLQVSDQRTLCQSLSDQIVAADAKLQSVQATESKLTADLTKIDKVLAENDLAELKVRYETYRTLQTTFEGLRHLYAKDDAVFKAQQRSLKILDEVPCGTQYPTCMFIKDAHEHKGQLESQREKVAKIKERLEHAETALVELQQEDLRGKIDKLEKLIALKHKHFGTWSTCQVDIKRFSDKIVALEQSRSTAIQRLRELEEAVKNEENVEVVQLRTAIDQLQREIKQLDIDKLVVARTMGGVQSDVARLKADQQRHTDVLQAMKAHELVAQAFSRKGIPSLVVTSQLPVINAEVAQILHGIVDFSIELEVDDDSDSMEVYINYGDSRRPVELGSGMEKMIASVAIRVALINVSSLPKPDMLIIDESFGALDDASVEACNRLLISLKSRFKNLIVITHVDGVKDCADHIVEITKVEKDAKVVYNQL